MKLDWGKSIFLFFVVFVSLSIVFIVFSFKHKPDLVTDNYYEEGAIYTQQIEINKRSVLYIDSVKLVQRNDAVVLSFSKSTSDELDSLEVHFYSPADKQNDYKIAAKEFNDSLVISKTQLNHGRYIIKISWQLNKEDYYIEKDIFIK